MGIKYGKLKCPCGKFGKPYNHDGYCSARAMKAQRMMAAARSKSGGRSLPSPKNDGKVKNGSADTVEVSAIVKAEEKMRQRVAPLCSVCGQKKRTATHENSYYHRHCLTCVECAGRVGEHYSKVGDSGVSLPWGQCRSLREVKQMRSRSQTNFDQAERLQLAGLTAETDEELDAVIRNFSQLAEENRPKYFKNKTPQQLKEFFTNARASLRERFPGCSFLTDNDNHKGKDLTVVETGQQVEIKSSPDKTDANNGLGVVAYATGISFDDLNNVMSPQERRGLKNPEDVEKSKRRVQRELSRLFNQIPLDDENSTRRIFNYVCAVSYGFTKREEIVEFIGRMETSNSVDGLNVPTQLMFTPSGYLQEYTERFTIGEDFNASVVISDDGHPFLRVEGLSSGVVGIIYPHYKNSWGKGENRQEAGDWVSSPCFHVWVKPGE